MGKNIYEIRCQCPISGALHFYTDEYTRREKREELCQCPISGALHFYNNVTKISNIKMKYVNALSRAHSISTPTPKIA